VSAIAPATTQRVRASGRLARQSRRFAAVAGVTLFAVMVASAFLMPLAYMVATAFKDQSQLTAVGAPLYPAAPDTF